MGERGRPKRLSALRVLMQIRPNALTQRGGDTVVMERITEGLRALGHNVDIDVDSVKNPADYDLIHLYNFATPDITEGLARRCVAANVPYVVTTMYEDWPLFVHQMAEAYYLVERYLELGQPKERWDDLVRAQERFPSVEAQDNRFTACYAEALIPTGTNERNALLRDYPDTKRVEEYRCGCEVINENADPQLFIDRFGVKDFILCVGRLETRKNQLMLLKALEHIDLPLVLATGGFTYQEKYGTYCRDFKRQGKTLFLEKLEPELLASAFAASRVHVLPSFFELPGLVNIEAARMGTNVVVTDFGTIRDYLGEAAFYCDPLDPSSIRNAVLNAYHSPRSPKLKESTREFTWENSAKRNLEIYETVLKDFGYVKDSLGAPVPAPPLQAALSQAATNVTATGATVSLIPVALPGGEGGDRVKAETLCAEADALAHSGNLDGAVEKFKAALKLDRAFPRVYRSLGALALSTSKLTEADSYFQKALILDPNDLKASIGAASVQWQLGEKERAFQTFRECLEKSPQETAALLYFMSACYELDRMKELESALLGYLKLDPENIDFHFCLAGCFYKQKNYSAARVAVGKILGWNALHKDALELRSLIDRDEERDAAVAPVASPTVSADRNDFDARIAKLEEHLRKKEYHAVLAGTETIETTLSEDQRTLLTIIRGEALALKGEFAGAEQLFRTSEKNNLYGYRAIAGRGIVAGACNNWDEASKFFERSLQINPTHDISYAGLGIFELLRGNEVQSWNAFTRALHINPENTRAILGLVQLAYSLGRLPELEGALQRYLEFSPANLSMLYTYAGCLYAQGKVPDAKAQIDKILLFEPGHQLATELLEKIEGPATVPSRAQA